MILKQNSIGKIVRSMKRNLFMSSHEMKKINIGKQLHNFLYHIIKLKSMNYELTLLQYIYDSKYKKWWKVHIRENNYFIKCLVITQQEIFFR